MFLHFCDSLTFFIDFLALYIFLLFKKVWQRSDMPFGTIKASNTLPPHNYKIIRTTTTIIKTILTNNIQAIGIFKEVEQLTLKAQNTSRYKELIS